MPLFGHRDNLRRLQEFGVPGLMEVAVSQGWEPLPGPPFAGALEAGVREITLALHGARPDPAAPEGRPDAGPTEFSDAYRGLLDGRTVIVANAWTSLAGRNAVSVCAVELACPVTLLSVQPHQFPPIPGLSETRAGRPDFDDRFLVQATADMPRPLQRILTAEAQQQMLARDDWFFRVGRGLLGCVGTEPFRSVDEVSQRISAVLAIAAVMPAALVMSAPVAPPPPPPAPAPDGYPRYPGPDGQSGPDRYRAPDEHRAPEQYRIAGEYHGTDGHPTPAAASRPADDLSPADLMARLSQLASLDEALAMLQALTPAERTVLAGLDTPLAALADVRTPQEATARYRTLDPQVKLQLAAMFMRPGAAARRR